MRGLTAALEDAADLTHAIDLDARFHTKFATAAGNLLVAYFMEGLQEVFVQQRHQATEGRDGDPMTRRAAICRDHREIMAAIEARDPDAAESALRQHLSRYTRLAVPDLTAASENG